MSEGSDIIQTTIIDDNLIPFSKLIVFCVLFLTCFKISLTRFTRGWACHNKDMSRPVVNRQDSIYCILISDLRAWIKERVTVHIFRYATIIEMIRLCLKASLESLCRSKNLQCEKASVSIFLIPISLLQRIIRTCSSRYLWIYQNRKGGDVHVERDKD